MNRDYILISAECTIIVMILILLIPKDKFREAQVAFFFMQLLTWILGLSVVELRLIEYPVRLFSYANRASFSFEYFSYPAICAVFNVHYPQHKSRFVQFLYYCAYCTVMTFLEVLAERNFQVVQYIHWDWYVTWIALFLTFFLTRKYYEWFFHLKEK